MFQLNFEKIDSKGTRSISPERKDREGSYDEPLSRKTSIDERIKKATEKREQILKQRVEKIDYYPFIFECCRSRGKKGRESYLKIIN